MSDPTSQSRPSGRLRLRTAAAFAAVLLTVACAPHTESSAPAPQSAVPQATTAAPVVEASPSVAPTVEATVEPPSDIKAMPLREFVAGTPSPSAAAESGRRVNPPPPGAADCSRMKCIALTFDDGPGPHTERLLGMLSSKDARATFFVTGAMVRANPGVARRIANTPGMEIANHSSTHPQLNRVGAAQLRREIVGNHATIREVTGKEVTVFRPPYGARNSAVDAMAAEAGEAVILWDVDTDDWRTRSASATRKAVADQARSGSIVLMHDIHGSTVDAVPGIISDLQGQGYVLVTVSEILGGSTPGRVYTRR
ncbi:polysaccharide deacetylase family protein [Ammonicoccus fulvus]|uniref:Polysaccharide deacetylase family protein n=1 Tax=Ammonicoccus fulvus TaxID=3138240 RepID=A0ABZ3FQ60_9ACTN